MALCPGGYDVTQYWETDDTDDTYLTSHRPNNRVMPPGLIASGDYEELLSSQLARCEGDYGCSAGPGQQIVIWYEAGDGDLSPDIEVTALHIHMEGNRFDTWSTNCSETPGFSRKAVYNRELQTPTVCSIPQDFTDQGALGEARLIGYTTGTHMHYQVHLDKSEENPPNDYFTRAYATTVNEAVDVVVSYDMHMPPGIGGKD